MSRVDFEFKYVGDQEKDGISNFELNVVNQTIKLADECDLYLQEGEEIEGDTYLFEIQNVRYKKTFRHERGEEAVAIIVMTHIYDVVRDEKGNPVKLTS